MSNLIIARVKSFLLLSFLSCVILWSCDRDDDQTSGPAMPLTIKSIAPESGIIGTSVIISGTNFSTTPKGNLVTFNGVTAAVTASTINSITAIVPVNAVSGNVNVTVNNEEAPGPVFNVTLPPPTITSVTPDRGAAGKEIVITGTNFSTIIEENIVVINGVEAVISQVTATSITTSVPTDAAEGVSAIVVTVQGVTVTGPDFTVPPAITLTIPIDEEEGDVEEAADGRMTLTSSDLELGEFDTYGTPDLGLQKIGLRFNNVAIPIGATIASASIQFTCDNTGSDPTEMTIYGENIGNSGVYTTTDFDLSNRAKTTASAIWEIPEWVATGDKLPAQKTIDLSEIVQEIVDRGDWLSGNSINFIMEASGPSSGTTSSTGGREAETYDVDQPELIITYLE
ncbi:IPT/TIG domain-containing protein [Aquimarina sediminis]|uniref:IPT/TIG domain-containing protein n=1 Tax=Aquimarina sediminis TaxID=2070536 RepID=UPI000CA02B92|nr:IPT/TIG domain-containing protein [Aquimarina sediminis]